MRKHIDKESYSGDRVIAAVKNNRQVIIKRSTSNADRLSKCAELQKTNRLFGENIFAVPISRIQKSSEFVEIEMPYKDGLNGETLYVYGDPIKIMWKFKELVDAVHTNLVTAVEHSQPEHFQLLASKKVESVYKQCIAKSDEKIPDSLSKEVYERLLGVLHAIHSPCPLGVTHGDLTFSNIIIEHNYSNIWLIDYLNNFVPSPYADFGKLIQEIKFGWSARYLSGPQATQAKILRHYLFGMLLEKIKDVDCQLIYYFSLLNLFRIAPYLTDEKTNNWLQFALQEEINCTY